MIFHRLALGDRSVREGFPHTWLGKGDALYVSSFVINLEIIDQLNQRLKDLLTSSMTLLSRSSPAQMPLLHVPALSFGASGLLSWASNCLLVFLSSFVPSRRSLLPFIPQGRFAIGTWSPTAVSRCLTKSPSRRVRFSNYDRETNTHTSTSKGVVDCFCSALRLGEANEDTLNRSWVAWAVKPFLSCPCKT